MEIIIQSLGFNAGEALRMTIKQKVNLLKKYSVKKARIILFKGNAEDQQTDYCEIYLEVPGNAHFVKKHSWNFENAVSECVEILKQMFRNSKAKLIDFNNPSGNSSEETEDSTLNPDAEDV